jgi:hypothetical protein
MHCLRFIAFASLASTLLAACGGGGGGGSPPPPPPPPPVPKTFADVTPSSGIAYDSGYRILPPIVHLREFSTSGVAAGDYDDDGDIDLFIVRGDIGPNLLYRNNGNAVFTEVAAAAGVAFTVPATSENYRLTGPAFADMDGDGDLDLFIAGVFGDPSFIYRNNGDGTFTDVTAGSGIDLMQAEHSISASFGDYDLDGDLDMFIAHWGTTYADLQNPGDTEHLWMNDTAGIGGTIHFISVSESAGISPTILTLPDPLVLFRDHDYTFTQSFARINDDIYPDIVVSADANQSMVFMNNGDGTFDNVTDVGVITDAFGMGSTLGDYDDDGDLDWFLSAILDLPSEPNPSPNRSGNRFYRNDGGVFVNATMPLGVLDGAWGWGACFMDFENDGDLDIYHTNGYFDGFQTDVSRAFVSIAGTGFIDRASELGLDDTEEGRGAVCADFDNDGDVDIFQTHRGSPVAATMWRNGSSTNNYLTVKLNGQPPNTEAAGARIYATIGSRTMMREIIIGNNFLSQNPADQYFGLGAFAQVDALTVEWPDGQMTNYGSVPAGQALTLNQPP